MTVMRQFVGESEVRMISFLLDKMYLKVRNGFEEGMFFRVFIGAPPGDSLTPVLFTIYLRGRDEVRKKHPPKRYYGIDPC